MALITSMALCLKTMPVLSLKTQKASALKMFILFRKWLLSMKSVLKGLKGLLFYIILKSLCTFSKPLMCFFQNSYWLFWLISLMQTMYIWCILLPIVQQHNLEYHTFLQCEMSRCRVCLGTVCGDWARFGVSRSRPPCRATSLAAQNAFPWSAQTGQAPTAILLRQTCSPGTLASDAHSRRGKVRHYT